MLDPQWKEQRQKSDARQATTTLSTLDIAANLKRLASQRSDVSGAVAGQPVLNEDDTARRKRVAVGAQDGQGGGSEPGRGRENVVAGGREGLNIEEQIRHIHQKFRG